MLSIEDSHYNFKKVCDNVKGFHKYTRQKYLEKQIQQRLVLANNFADSPWYCVDMEYAMSLNNAEEAKCGRADIVAISRRPFADNKFHILMIELKVGTKSFGGSSGILGHFTDFVNYTADKDYDCGEGYKGRFTRLRGEVVDILKNYQSLEILPQDMRSAVDTMTIYDIGTEPQMIFLIYSGDVTKQQAEDSFKLYVGGEACEGISRSESKYTIVKAWNEEIVKRVFRDSIKCVFREGNASSAINYKQPLFEDEEISEAVQIFK